VAKMVERYRQKSIDDKCSLSNMVTAF